MNHQTTKNVLLNRFCDSCRFGYGTVHQHNCKKVVYNTIEEANEEGYITVEQLYPEENTCENWEKLPELEFNFKTIKVVPINKPIDLSWTKETEIDFQ